MFQIPRTLVKSHWDLTRGDKKEGFRPKPPASWPTLRETDGRTPTGRGQRPQRNKTGPGVVAPLVHCLTGYFPGAGSPLFLEPPPTDRDHVVGEDLGPNPSPQTPNLWILWNWDENLWRVRSPCLFICQGPLPTPLTTSVAATPVPTLTGPDPPKNPGRLRRPHIPSTFPTKGPTCL